MVLVRSCNSEPEGSFYLRKKEFQVEWATQKIASQGKWQRLQVLIPELVTLWAQTEVTIFV